MARRFFGFVLTSVALFGLTVIFLAAVDVLPETALSTSVPERVVAEAMAPSGVPEAPIRIVAQKVGLDSAVVNPSSTDIDVLDAALLEGAVRYPTSGQLGINGTVFLLGHSTSLPIVRNQVYKTFNNIQKLKEGDVISVYSGTLEYRYRVTGVETANATLDTVSLPEDGMYLKLVTCNTAGKKEDRYIVSAVFVGAFSSEQNN